MSFTALKAVTCSLTEGMHFEMEINTVKFFNKNILFYALWKTRVHVSSITSFPSLFLVFISEFRNIK